MVQHRFTRETVVKNWLEAGVRDFLIAFILTGEKTKDFPWQVAFFYQQGVEKLCKAYILGERSDEYEKEPTEEKAWKVILSIVKDKEEASHNMSNML